MSDKKISYTTTLISGIKNNTKAIQSNGDVVAAKINQDGFLHVLSTNELGELRSIRCLLEQILSELKISNFHNQTITGNKITKIDVE